MQDYRLRPKGDYILKACSKDLYVMSENWKNNLEFQMFEIEFIERLMDTYFSKLLLNHNLDVLRELQREIYLTKNQLLTMIKRNQMQLNNMGKIIEEPFKYETSIFRAEYELFEDEITEFVNVVKTIKHTVYKIMEDILESEIPKFIWKYN